jgi:TolB-like protein
MRPWAVGRYGGRAVPRVVSICLVFLCVASYASVVSAQCPDGSPPPCATRAARVTVPAANSVAVLYFDNLSRDTAYAYLADGVTEELITSLRLAGHLTVPSRNESARIRQLTGQAPALTARQLGVRYLLSGSVQPTGDRLRVNAELLEAASGRVVWGDRIVVPGRDPMAAQESIAVAVVSAVRGALQPEERRALARRPTQDSLAYDFYLRGRRALWAGSAEDAIALFEQALARDSTFALAAAGAAVAWSWEDDVVTPMVAQTQARVLAERALRLDSTVALAWFALASAAFQAERDLDRAARYARRAIALDSSFAEPHAVLSDIAVLRGRAREAAAEAAQAWRLDSLSGLVQNYRSLQLGLLGDTAAMARYHAQLAPIIGSRPRDTAALALARGYCQDVITAFRSRPEPRSRATYAVGLACNGQNDAARALRDSLVPELRFTEPSSLAEVSLAFGDRDGALAWLERAVIAREYFAIFIGLDHRWITLRGDPRFEALRRRVAGLR